MVAPQLYELRRKQENTVSSLASFWASAFCAPTELE